MESQFSLSGKKVLITGASSGIGRQCAVSCAEAGASLAIVDKNYEGLQEIAGVLNDCLPISVDLTDFKSVENSVSNLKSTFGKVDGVINCIGISSTLPFGFIDPELMEKFFKVNVFAGMNLTRLLLKGGFCHGGSIIFIASVMSVVGAVGKTHYSMTKGAILSGVRSLALELASRSIRVNAVSPGVIVTPINMNLPHIADPQKRKETEAMHPLGLGKPEDIANACVFLLSDASRWMTGQNLIIDGGYTLR
ncbi:uncharacterized protein BN796_01784 [Alistipes sp. CAG:831]|nr:uncharacterized protein BN796_01784 [Alistipes sp. CAG:831]